MILTALFSLITLPWASNQWLPAGNQDSLQPWDIDALKLIAPARQIGDWRIEYRNEGSANLKVAVSDFRGQDGSEFVGVYRVPGRGIPAPIALNANRQYLVCGQPVQLGRLVFHSYGNSDEHDRLVSATLVPNSPSEIAIEALLPWSEGQAIDYSDRGHSVLLGLAQSLASPDLEDARLARHEFAWLGVNQPNEKKLRQWVREVLAPRIADVQPPTAVHAFWQWGVLVTWRIPAAVPGFLDALEAVAAVPVATDHDDDIAFLTSCDLTSWAFQNPYGGDSWAGLGSAGQSKLLGGSDRLMKIALLTANPVWHRYALSQMILVSSSTRGEVFKLLDSPDEIVVRMTLGMLALWSRKPDRAPALGGEAAAYNKHLVKVWKAEGSAAILSGK